MPALLFSGVTLLSCTRSPQPVSPEPVPVLPSGPAVSYESDVKPVLEQRCAVCHGCYDAPCQLLLTSYEGVTRGATKAAVYQSSRLEAAPPTRLFIDAASTGEWHQRGFWPVVAAGASGADWSRSLVGRMIAHGRRGSTWTTCGSNRRIYS